jgi:sulfonate transport system ATP-binding protein
MGAALEVISVEKRFGGRVVLDGVSLSLRPGEICALAGASGCGKSTLLRIIAGLDGGYGGSLRLSGAPLAGRSRDIGFVFQEPRLLPWLTVAGNVGFGLGTKGARAPRVDELLREVGLTGLRDALPKQLSGGQAQRVALARGLFAPPRLLLLDEPFSALDAFTRMRLQDLLQQLALDHGVTTLLVTHDLDEALYLADRVLILGGGVIRGEVEVPLPRPRDRGEPALMQLKVRALGDLFAAHAGLPAAHVLPMEKPI